MKPLKLFVDVVLWVAWVAATWAADVTGLALVAVAALVVWVARHDWALGRRPFDKINAE